MTVEQITKLLEDLSLQPNKTYQDYADIQELVSFKKEYERIKTKYDKILPN